MKAFDENDAAFERLKTELFNQGHDAVSDFLGYDYPVDESKDVTESRMDEAYRQMPDEELRKYYEKFLRQ